MLDLFGFQLCDSAAKAEFERRAQRLAMLSTQPVFILREALQYLKQQRIVAPIYTFLQDMVGRCRECGAPARVQPAQRRPHHGDRAAARRHAVRR
nr:DUF4158 domain-containing protein [Paraburkholderia aspalathi]